ncbi:MAG: hypothetical protein ISR97_00555 [Nitrospira sp.]|nr:hypothetical protein [Nitrospira sp.]
MKTILTTIAVLSILVIGTMAFAHGNGGWGSGQMGQSSGGHMMDRGYGGHMGQGYGKGGGPGAGVDQEFLNKTVDLRKAMHDKKFEYREAARNPETTNKELTKIEREMFDIKSKIREIAPRSANSGNGPCWER